VLPANDLAGLALRHVVTGQVLGSMDCKSLHYGTVVLLVLPDNIVAGLALRNVVTRQVLVSTACSSLHHGTVELLVLPANIVTGLALRNVVTRQVLVSMAYRSLHHWTVELVVVWSSRCYVGTFHKCVNRAEVGMIMVMNGLKLDRRGFVMRMGLGPVMKVDLVRTDVVLMEDMDRFMAHGSHNRLSHARMLEVIIFRTIFVEPIGGKSTVVRRTFLVVNARAGTSFMVVDRWVGRVLSIRDFRTSWASVPPVSAHCTVAMFWLDERENLVQLSLRELGPDAVVVQDLDINVDLFWLGVLVV